MQGCRRLSRVLRAATLAWLYGQCIAAATPLPIRVPPGASHAQRLRAAKDLLNEAPLIDGHNDMARNLRQLLQNKIHSFNFSSNLGSKAPWSESKFSHTDLPRLRKSKVAAQVWATLIPCESQYLNAVQLLMEQVDVIRRVIAAHKDFMVLSKSTEDIRSAFEQRTLASIISVEGGHGVGSSMGVIRSLYDLGVRSMTLTHRCHTPWAECSDNTTDKPNSRGLTPFGKEIVKELNRLGMIIDLSHSSSQTARDVLSLSKAPVIFSHSAAKSVCDIPSNVPDDVIEFLTRNEGLVMITFSNTALSCEQNASLADVVAHINHVRSLAGVDYVGLGAGFDGINRTPEGLKDVSSYPELFAELLKDQSWSVQDLKKLAGLNFLRVFSRVEEVRDDMIDMQPSEEIIPIHDIDSRWPCRYKFANLDVRKS